MPVAAQVSDLRPGERVRAGQPDEPAKVDRLLRRETATFSDPAIEGDYRTYLATEAFGRELYLQCVGVAAFLSYGFLDLLTVGDKSVEFLAIRCLLVGPVGALGVALTAIPKLRRHQQLSTIIGFTLYCASIIYMIAAMPAGGAPPYIIGVLVTMIFTSCLMRVNFPVAACAFMFVSLLYCAVLAARADAAPTDKIAGYFFMISVAAVAIVTSYAQEMRAREIWFRNVQREKDAARISQLLVEATAADQSKLNFLSVLTHELRTPLHQIIGFSEIARTEAKNAAAADVTGNLDQVLQSAHVLLKKIGQMLRYADATAGKLDFVIDEAPVREIIDQLLDQFGEQAALRGVAIEAKGVEPTMLALDLHHSTYALSNLLDNALNVSPRGARIVISSSPAGDGRYRLSIRDNGPGMSAAKIAAALEPFNQGEAVHTRSREGLGLGLSIARKLIERQGGSLTVTSSLDAGTTIDAVFQVATGAVARAC